MINFRFHIVSLTAVLLALGIGLVLGTTFLDDATVNTLENQLSDLERSLDAAGDRNTRQQQQIDSYEQETAALDEQLGERLFGASDAGRDDVRGLSGGPAQTAEGEPAVIARLREGGFIDYQMPEGVDEDVIVLPTSGLRVVFVGGPGAELSPE